MQKKTKTESLQKATGRERGQHAKISFHLLRELGCASFLSEICPLLLAKASLQAVEILTQNEDDRAPV